MAEAQSPVRGDVIPLLAAYFAMNTLFSVTRAVELGAVRFDLPVWPSVDPVAVGITVLALGLIFGRSWSPLGTLGVCAGLGLVVGVIGLVT